MHHKELKLFGQTLHLTIRNDGDEAVANEVFRDREYGCCDAVIKQAKHAILDVGGHAGFFALYAATLNPTVPIYTFEPHEDNFRVLKTHLKENRIKNVQPKNLAVWKEEGPVELKLSQEDLNHSLVHAIEDDGGRQKVNATTLEKIFSRQEFGQVDLLKLDCEGAEFSILMDTPKTIFDKVLHIILEYHDWVPGVDHQRLKIHLEKMGYKVQDFPNHKMQELGFLWAQK